jgi:hypothetical protein
MATCGIFAFPGTEQQKEGRKGWGTRGKGNLGTLVPSPLHHNEGDRTKGYDGPTAASHRVAPARPRREKSN